jgi:hypothetical protein
LPRLPLRARLDRVARRPLRGLQGLARMTARDGVSRGPRRSTVTERKPLTFEEAAAERATLNLAAAPGPEHAAGASSPASFVVRADGQFPRQPRMRPPRCTVSDNSDALQPERVSVPTRSFRLSGRGMGEVYRARDTRRRAMSRSRRCRTSSPRTPADSAVSSARRACSPPESSEHRGDLRARGSGRREGPGARMRRRRDARRAPRVGPLSIEEALSVCAQIARGSRLRTRRA